VSGFWSIRRLLAGTMVAAVAASGVTLFGQAAAPSTAPASGPGVTTSGPSVAQVTVTSLDEPIALINGKAVNNRFLYSVMMQIAGPRVFEKVMDLVLVQDACDNAGIPLQGTEYQKRMNDELEKIMDGMSITSTKTNAEEAQKERLAVLNAVLNQRGMTATEFRLILETRTMLRALSDGRVTAPTDAEIKEAYDSQYGEQRKIHVIGYDPAKTSAVKIKEAIKSAKVVDDAIRDLQLGGSIFVVPKNAKTDPTFEDIKKVTFEQLKAPGEVSQDVLVTAGGNKQHVLVVLDEITKDKTSAPENAFDKVKKDVAKKVLDAKQSQWMDERLTVLRSKASIQFKDPTLAEIYAARTTQGPASQPAATGTAPAAPAPAAPAPAAPAPASAPASAPATSRPTGR
jgi:hypothetical protein